MSNKTPAPYWNSYTAGIGLGLVLLATFLIMGRGLGSSGAMTRMSVYMVHKVDAAFRGGTKAEGNTIAQKNKYMAKYLTPGKDPFGNFLVYLFRNRAVFLKVYFQKQWLLLFDLRHHTQHGLLNMTCNYYRAKS